MSLQSLIIKSPMFTTIVPSTGVALIHCPSLFSTCLQSPELVYCTPTSNVSCETFAQGIYSQAASHILPQECEQLEISVASQTNCIISPLFLCCHWVKIKHAVCSRICSLVVEIVFLQIKWQRKSLHKFSGQSQTCCPICEDLVLET